MPFALPVLAFVLSAQGVPSDGELLEVLRRKTPEAEVTTYAVRPSPRAGGRIGCGRASIAGRVEPFLIIALPPGVSSRRSERADGWVVTASVPSRVALAAGGGDRSDRNWDALDRRLILASCPDLNPPSGQAWKTHRREPGPDAGAKRTEPRNRPRDRGRYSGSANAI